MRNATNTKLARKKFLKVVAEMVWTGDNWVPTGLTINKETEKAVCVALGNIAVWLPKSHIEIANGKVVGITSWMAIEKGIDAVGIPKFTGGTPTAF